MTPGSCMESQSGSGQAGIGIQGCTLPDRELRLAWALASASLAAMAGDGTTGDTIGVATESSSTTTPTSPTAESSPITTRSITRVQTSIMAADFMGEVDFRAGARVEVRGSMDQPRSMDLYLPNMDLRRRMSSLVVIPAR